MIGKPEFRLRPTASGAAAVLVVLLMVWAGPAAGGWLSTANDVRSAGSNFKTLKKYFRSLAGSADKAIDGAIEGDSGKVDNAWKEAQKATGELILDYVPVLRVALDAPGKIKQRLQAAGHRVKSRIGDVRSALAISQDEKKEYAAKGIIGGKPLPSPRFEPKVAPALAADPWAPSSVAPAAASAWDRLPRDPPLCGTPHYWDGREECEKRVEERIAQNQAWERRMIAAGTESRALEASTDADDTAPEPAYRAALQGTVETKRLEKLKLEQERTEEEERRRLARLEEAEEKERRRFERELAEQDMERRNSEALLQMLRDITAAGTTILSTLGSHPQNSGSSTGSRSGSCIKRDYGTICE